MKQFIFFLLLFVSGALNAQFEGNTTPTYPELIEIYQQYAKDFPEIELYEMGSSDYGLPIYTCVINGAQDSVQTFEKARNKTTLLINNAIHPGEPDGVNACLIWIQQWIKAGRKTEGLPVIAIIPAYNVGGMMNRSSSSRANQDGPEEYGFRGNAQNLDLNRDFIKMDSKNMFTFAKIYHGLEPDVFLDAHVSNGADYQYVMTYIASVKERMSPALADLMYDDMIPFLEKESARKGFELSPYVYLKGKTPESGIQVFNDLPRYAMGYASLLNSFSFTLETHMLKPFPERVQSTLVFIESTIDWMSKHFEEIEEARDKTLKWEQNLENYLFNYSLTDKKDKIRFKGYEFSEPISEITGLKRLKYHQDRPYEKDLDYYKTYAASDTVRIPTAYIIGGQCSEVINRLKANNVEMTVIDDSENWLANQIRVNSFDSGNRPYEGHFLHSKITADRMRNTKIKRGDVYVPTDQKNRRFIISVLEPEAPDSYFAWNFFDSYVQQKEYFSPYVFEDKAKDILSHDPDLRKRFEALKEDDKEFRESAWEQLYFIYQNSEFYEPTHNYIPVFVVE